MFHGFGQAKFENSGLILGSSKFILQPMAPAASKNNALFKSSQN
jgi:hypothetical protein